MGARGPKLIIALEGIEGSGKTLHIGMLNEYLRNQGYQTILAKEPSQFMSGVIKKQRGGALSAEANALLFAADRLKQFEEVIKPALKEGKVVLLDRSIFSSFAYQYAQGASLDWLETINRCVPLPGLVVFLDVNPEIGLRRVAKRNEVSNFDKTVNEIALQVAVRSQYFQLADKYNNRMAIINTINKSVEEVQELIRKIVLGVFQKGISAPTEKEMKVVTPSL